jgi:hypothetical protein
MTIEQLEARLNVLERDIAELKAKLSANGKEQSLWWLAEVGRFANDPEHAEAVRLGREWRKSQNRHPKKRKKATVSKKRKQHADS